MLGEIQPRCRAPSAIVAVGVMNLRMAYLARRGSSEAIQRFDRKRGGEPFDPSSRAGVVLVAPCWRDALHQEQAAFS